MSKVLVAFFSASGVTRRPAQKIAIALKGDIFEIEPVDLYTDEDLNWLNQDLKLLKKLIILMIMIL